MSNLQLAPNDLKKYVAGIFDTELNLYIQEQTLLRMKNTYNSLGREKNIAMPEKSEPQTVVADHMLTVGIIGGGIFGIVMGILQLIGTGFSFGDAIVALIFAIICAVAGTIVCALTLGVVVGLLMLNREKKMINAEYEETIENYNLSLLCDDSRVRNENLQKSALLKDINAMKRRIEETKNNLQKMYGCGIISPDYRNIYAVSSIHGYLQKGRTRSLSFNEKTGDQGAYNIYEYEMRMNMIITNTQEILNRLDDISRNQYELAEGLRRANSRINSLCSSINTHIKNTDESLKRIEACQSIIAYNSQRTREELEFITWMNILY